MPAERRRVRANHQSREVRRRSSQSRNTGAKRPDLSVARGEADDEGDLGLLVEPLPGFILLRSLAMTRELEGVLGRRSTW